MVSTSCVKKNKLNITLKPYFAIIITSRDMICVFEKTGLFLGRCMLYPQIKVIYRYVIVTQVNVMNIKLSK